MTASEKLIREYAERTNAQVICIDLFEYGSYFAILKDNAANIFEKPAYMLVMLNCGHTKVEPIRCFTNWRDAKRAYTALAYEP